ncbi:MAG: von Willebrand factor type A domain-containing protein [Cyclobacteriaceae bacterium]|nr:von Willebrand factor type A domain-containing protein [Cyclobacteriaceae bacterium]
MKQIMITIWMLLLMAWTPTSNSITISGTVYSQEDNYALPGVNVLIKGTTTGAVTDINGKYSLTVPSEGVTLIFSTIGYVKKEIKVGKKRIIDVRLATDVAKLSEIVLSDEEAPEIEKRSLSGKVSGVRVRGNKRMNRTAPANDASYGQLYDRQPQPFNTEEYAAIREIGFLEPTKQPLSTFSIDVDAASYSNMRRFLQQGQNPPKDAVRIEELVNYFSYDYKQPSAEHPFSVNTELSTAPWNEGHYLLHIGLQGKKIPLDNLPASNLVFLIDVSGSMNSPNKLGLLKTAFKMLTKQLRAQDKVSIVVYAGAAGVVLSPTAGDRQQTIMDALEKLQAGGSTAGGAGIKLAYKLAEEQFVSNGNNRVILATDGDFNIGASSNAEMERLIEKEREKGVFLTVLGFGMGNYKDSKMEILADKGNGNYAYIDNALEAKKVLVSEFGGTLFTIAKDVKLQIEFNPAQVKAYRLLGYENRMLQDEDFNDDKKDAGELGSGHTVTALYEIIPADYQGESPYIKSVDELKYQNQSIKQNAVKSKDLMTLKLRYKQPKGTRSQLIVHEVPTNVTKWGKTSDNFRWSAAVAGFGMLLRDSEFKGNANYHLVEQWARSAQGEDREGYRAEFIRLIQSGELLAKN